MSWRKADHPVPQERFNAKCIKCGEQTSVPFRPDSGKPVYCRDCWALYSP